MSVKRFLQLSDTISRLDSKIDQVAEQLLKQIEKSSISDCVIGSDSEFLIERRFTIRGRLPNPKIEKLEKTLSELRAEREKLIFEMALQTLD